MSRTSELSLNLRVEYSFYYKYCRELQTGSHTYSPTKLEALISKAVTAIDHFKAMCESELAPEQYPAEYHYPDVEAVKAPVIPEEPKRRAARHRTYSESASGQLSLF